MSALSLIGYITEREAAEHGFTHHASYYGLPVWIGDLDTEAPMVATKWAPAEWLMSAMHVIEGLMLTVFFPEREPSFMFKVGAPIGED